jgi:hypothetical protein
MWAVAGMTSQIGEMIWVRDGSERRGYWIDDVCTLHPDMTVEGTQPIPVPRLNLKRAAQACRESGFNDYRDWWRAKVAKAASTTPQRRSEKC